MSHIPASAEELQRMYERGRSTSDDHPDFVPIAFVPRVAPEPWPDPDPSLLRRGRRPPVPFPDNVLAPEWDQWVRDTAKSAGAPPDYVAMPLLSALAALIGNARLVSPWGIWKEPSILWTGIVGDPSSGKSPGSDPVLSLVRSIERERAECFDATYRQWQTQVASAEIIRDTWNGKVREAIKNGVEPPTMPDSACSPLEPERPRIITSDVTLERLGAMLGANPKGLFSVRDELSGWLLGFDRYSKSGERSFWIEAYGGRAFTIDRVKAGGSIAIPNLSISVFGGVQPDRLTTLLFSGDDDGLPARFIWAWPDPLPPTRPTVTVSNDAVRVSMSRLADLRPGRSDSGDYAILMRLDAKAADEFQRWREEHAENIRATAGLVESAWGKLPGTLLRIAMLLELSAWAIAPMGTPEPAEISETSVVRAAIFTEEYVKPMVERVYGDAAMPLNERHASGLARRIAHGKLSRINTRQIARSRTVPGLTDKATIDGAIAILVEACWLRADDTPTGGRPARNYTVNPRVRDLVERSHG